jgi:hypothetical protein
LTQPKGQQEQEKKQQQEKKSTRQEQQQDAKPQKQEQQQEKSQLKQQQANRPSQQVQHGQRGEQQAAWQEHRAHDWKSEHRDWQQRGGHNGYRIPEDRYRGYFGPSHAFRIYSYPVVVVGGYPRFQYGGFWLSVVDPWPEYWSDDWYDNDDVYIEYYGGILPIQPPISPGPNRSHCLCELETWPGDVIQAALNDTPASKLIQMRVSAVMYGNLIYIRMRAVWPKQRV